MLVDLFLDFDKTDRLADCSHEFTCVEFIKRWLLAFPLRYFSLLSRNVDIVVYIYFVEFTHISRGKQGLVRIVKIIFPKEC